MEDKGAGEFLPEGIGGASLEALVEFSDVLESGFSNAAVFWWTGTLLKELGSGTSRTSSI